MARIVMVGGALVDVRARTVFPWVPDRSLPGVVRLGAGGAARNVAVDLVRFGHHVTLLTAVGCDPLGRWLLERTAEDGVDTGAACRIDGQTGVYVTVGPESGLPWCVSSAGVMEALTAAHVARWRSLLATADVVVADANLTTEAAGAVALHAGGRPRVLLMTSPAKAPRLTTVLPGAAALIGRQDEGVAITGLPADADWRTMGHAILGMGVAEVVLTDGTRGVAVVTPTENAWAPAPAVRVVDPTGAGDAAAAAVVHAFIRRLGPADTAALAVAAASVAVQSEENTPAALSALT